jgi:hypothetical protein
LAGNQVRQRGGNEPENLESGLVRKLEVPGLPCTSRLREGQCLRLVGIDEDLSFYEGAGEGPNVEKVKEAVRKIGIKK